MGAMVAEEVIVAEDKWSTERLKVSTKERIDNYQNKKPVKFHNADEVVAFMLDFYEANKSNGGKGVGDGVQV